MTIIAGSDSGLTNFPQGGGLEEICTYVELIGMAPHEALLTATRDAARVIGFDDTGTLEPGKRADLDRARREPTRADPRAHGAGRRRGGAPGRRGRRGSAARARRAVVSA